MQFAESIPPLVPLATAAALLPAGYVLWIRRHTWRTPWETAATLNVLLLGLNALLTAPRVDRWVSPKLHSVTGWWNVEELIGHLCYLCALMSLLYMAAARLDMTDRQLNRFINSRIRIPATVFIPWVVFTFFYGGCADRYVPDLLLLDPSPWQMCYRWLYIVATVFLLGQAATVLLILRRDPYQTRAADLYLAAIALTFMGCFAFIFDCNDVLRWALIRVVVVAYAVAAGYSWRSKLRYLRGTPPLPCDR
ncbi:hypothetical protein A5760_23060 [Mycobacterium colombiense]|uniref:Histidine kinase N-terminal 7TM region domain-containing protein n=1 Tax=Mycobacterium colombiense TaxID=339268 RepID=A0A1A0W0U9_9MYCO|nr:hypothetical protein [Mycobacterium colombiense]OBB89123.1 hypothetical protein A5760_23060 [Mycobacterium colombiense]